MTPAIWLAVLALGLGTLLLRGAAIWRSNVEEIHEKSTLWPMLSMTMLAALAATMLRDADAGSASWWAACAVVGMTAVTGRVLPSVFAGLVLFQLLH